jgi:NAD-dependent dihydropyrimidine dehydrogenase PreA subunit
MEYPVVNKDECTGCGACIDVCPMDAIELIDRIAKIDNDNCSNCQACVSECPVEAIKA